MSAASVFIVILTILVIFAAFLLEFILMFEQKNSANKDTLIAALSLAAAACVLMVYPFEMLDSRAYFEKYTSSDNSPKTHAGGAAEPLPLPSTLYQ